ncbi:DUF4344 domain-containing metallopeptidase [Natronoglycomyces albus]|uniref:Uncharacterized protein n=1 Tax=Natronoglycomyces albus TaxID=2811108 RepID=A0A895XMJ9_9ACTN|nr:DUF4344 domain-containing metallopeptidase [Natronoglycomyces albus]QSB04763.1 hypothetical protein JQS30_13470 [Natronoglycomyces albus]
MRAATGNKTHATETVSHAAVAMILAAVVLTGCSAAPGGPAQSGTITVEYEPTQKHPQARDLLVEGAVMDTAAEELAAELWLVDDLHLLATDCDTNNAYYDPQVSQVTICYELIEEYRLSADIHQRPTDRFVHSLVTETTYHEIAHALIDQLELPITGNEEDVADQFVAYQLLASEEDHRDILLDVIDQYLHYGEHAQIDTDALADTHSLDSQRAYNYACYLYGSDREKGQNLIEAEALTEERAEYCPEEYRRAMEGWTMLLEDHRR